MVKNKNSVSLQIIIFVGLTYLVSATLFLTGYFTDLMPVIILGVWTPTLSALILNFVFYGKNGFKNFIARFNRIKVKWYYWFLLLFLPGVIHFCGLSIWQLIYYHEIKTIVLPLEFWTGAIIPSFLIAGLGEELGWRGFLLPRLQSKYSVLTAAIILSFIHLLWHFPTYWIGQGIHNVPFIYTIGFIVPWTIIFNWLYNKSGGSLVFAVGFHAVSNSSLSIVRFLPLESEIPITTDLITRVFIPLELAGPYLTVSAVYIITAILIVKFGKFKEASKTFP